MKLKINKKKWLRGDDFSPGGTGSKLYRSEDGKMCCLGFLGEACGVPKEVMRDVSYPSQLPKAYFSLFPKALRELLHESDLCHKLITNNDRTRHKNRPRAIKKLMKEAGIDVEFVD